MLCELETETSGATSDDDSLTLEVLNRLVIIEPHHSIRAENVLSILLLHFLSTEKLGLSLGKITDDFVEDAALLSMCVNGMVNACWHLHEVTGLEMAGGEGGGGLAWCTFVPLDALYLSRCHHKLLVAIMAMWLQALSWQVDADSTFLPLNLSVCLRKSIGKLSEPSLLAMNLLDFLGFGPFQFVAFAH